MSSDGLCKVGTTYLSMLLIALTCAPAAGALRYTITELPTLAGYNMTYGYAMNALGEVVGHASGGPGGDVAVMWYSTNATPTVLTPDYPGDTWYRALAISDDDRIAIGSLSDGTDRTVLYRLGVGVEAVLLDFSSLSSQHGYAACTYHPPGYTITEAALVTDSQTYYLGWPTVPVVYRSTRSAAANDFAHVAVCAEGPVDTTYPSARGYLCRPVGAGPLWTDLGTLPNGYKRIVPTAMNNLDEIVGYAYDTSGSYRHAFLWRPEPSGWEGTITDLSPSAWNAEARCVSESGYILGTDAGQWTLWRNGRQFTITPADANWYNLSLCQVLNDGRIIGHGGYNCCIPYYHRCVILTPTSSVTAPTEIWQCREESTNGAQVTVTARVEHPLGYQLSVKWDVDGYVVRTDTLPETMDPPRSEDLTLTQLYGIGRHKITITVSDGHTPDSTAEAVVRIAQPPSITKVTPDNGAAPYDYVLVYGRDIANATQVTLGTMDIPSFSREGERLLMVVPEGATSGMLKVTTPCGTAVAPFVVCPRPANDSASGAVLVTSVPYDSTQSNCGAYEYGDLSMCRSPMKGIWYTYTPSADCTIIADAEGQGFLAEVQGSDANCMPVSALCANDRVQNRLVFRATGGRQYYFGVGTAFNYIVGRPVSAGDITFRLRVAGREPAVVYARATPNQVLAGERVHVQIGTVDDVDVARVLANGVELSHTRQDTWEGDIAADGTFGEHSISVTVWDSESNTSNDDSTSYFTGRTVGSSLRALRDPIWVPAASHFLFKVWGQVTCGSRPGCENYDFWIDDGSGYKAYVVLSQPHTLATGDYVSVEGTISELDYGDLFTQITAKPGSLHKLR